MWEGIKSRMKHAFLSVFGRIENCLKMAMSDAQLYYPNTTL